MNVDFQDPESFTARVVLNLPSSEIQELLNTEGFDARKMKLTLQVNGMNIPVEHFDKVASDLHKRSVEAIEKQLGWLEKAEAVDRRADEKLATLGEGLVEQMHDLMNKLSDYNEQDY